ncbi:MAG TPA: alginate export family protein, partial [Rhizomicrobium sp.]|nr:alginate export family protein [Rhizomicrobium sp.]
DRRRTKFTAEGVLASGDKDRTVTAGTFGGNAPHTRDGAFNSLGVIYDGLAFTPPISNLMVLRVGASTYPVPDGALRGLQVGADFFVLGKARIAAPIDEPTNNSRYLGCEPDVFINWQITDDVSFALRYGLFFPGEAIPSGDQDHVRQFLYAAVTYAF